MAIVAGQDILDSDFVDASSGSADSGKVAKLNSNGQINPGFIINGFGGNGSDGVLNVTSGTTNIDAGGANVIVKNYSSINVSSGATLGLTNPASNGTILILKCKGDVTIEGTIDLTGDGADAETNGFEIHDDSADHEGATGVTGAGGTGGTGGAGGAILGNKFVYITPDADRLYRKYLIMACGSGGGNGGDGDGGATGGAGGRGGGVLIIECGGNLDFDSGGVININGADGSNGATGVGGSGGGGGGAAGMCLVLYNGLTDNSGTINAKGGAGGDGGLGSPAQNGDRASGGGGGGAASYTAAGNAGGDGKNFSAAGDNGTNTTNASGAGGGGGGAPDGAGGSTQPGGTGGTQGSTDSNHYLITSNIFF